MNMQHGALLLGAAVLLLSEKDDRRASYGSTMASISNNMLMDMININIDELGLDDNLCPPRPRRKRVRG